MDDSNINNSSQLKRVRGSKERRDELVHFDLYTKGENKFVKHLASYTKDEDSNNLSLKIDLSEESSFLPNESIKDQHVVVMSFTDSNNRPKQPNITLTFSNANSNSDLISERATNIPLSFRSPDFDQRFSRTHSSNSHFTTATTTTTLGKSSNINYRQNNNNKLLAYLALFVVSTTIEFDGLHNCSFFYLLGLLTISIIFRLLILQVMKMVDFGS